MCRVCCDTFVFGKTKFKPWDPLIGSNVQFSGSRGVWADNIAYQGGRSRIVYQMLAFIVACILFCV